MNKYLIIGGTGSLGRKLVDRLLINSSVGIMSRDETKQWSMKNELSGSHLEFYIGDIRDLQRVKDVLRQYKPTHVIIAAAIKHIDACESHVYESILTNTIGTQNVINAINEIDASFLQCVCFISTDKACSPVNVYGMSKALSERVITSQSLTPQNNIKYIVVRYGNVLESRGSVIPLFKFQALNKEKLTVTEPDMTRFIMTLDDSVNLILEAIRHGSSGETWIPKLSSMRIGDLAEIFAKKYNREIESVGLRPGEKLHEDLINQLESIRTYSTGNFYAILPAHSKQISNRFAYTSNDAVLSKLELEIKLKELQIEI